VFSRTSNRMSPDTCSRGGELRQHTTLDTL